MSLTLRALLLRIPRGVLLGSAAILAAVPVAFVSRRLLHEILEHQDDVFLLARSVAGWITSHATGLLAGVVSGADLRLCPSTPMQNVRDLVQRVARTDATVVITGESGVGKETVACAIHDGSPRRGGPFVKVNCAAIPAELFESEFFGHERGAFTNAAERRRGRFEVADRGTLFLDEVAEMPLEMQAKLLHVLQDGEVYPVGAVKPRAVDVRVIAATSRPLAAAVETGEFREDLFYRLNVVPIHVSPLRERTEDIPVLVEHFRQRLAAEHSAVIDIGPETRQLFLRYPWPGNVRELETMVRRIAVLGTDDVVRDELAAKVMLVPDGVGARERHVALPQSLRDIARQASQNAERIAILHVMNRVRWKRGDAARALGISYRALLYKLAQFGFSKSSGDHDGREDDTTAA